MNIVTQLSMMIAWHDSEQHFAQHDIYVRKKEKNEDGKYMKEFLSGVNSVPILTH